MCKIEFEIPKAGYVTVKVVDILGTPVKSLINSHKEAGLHFIDFNNEDLLPGKYYYKVFLSESEKDVNHKNGVIIQGKLQISNE